MNVHQQQHKGFTIIEVILVLAIAGLIFLMVFLALPALQRGQRDTARKNDASIVAKALTEYSTNNNGKFPTTAAQIQTFAENVSGNSQDTSGKANINLNTTKPATATAADGVIGVYIGKKCGTVSGETATFSTTGGSARSAAIVTLLESGGKTAYCLDN